MKRTSSVVYRETIESRELHLYGVNNDIVYRHFKEVSKNLKKKIEKGTYDSDKAIDAFYHVANTASKEYEREFGYGFSVQDRFTCACDLKDDFEEEVYYNE